MKNTESFLELTNKLDAVEYYYDYNKNIPEKDIVNNPDHKGRGFFVIPSD